MPQNMQTRAERRSQLKRGLAKDLRKDATEPERKLWSFLRGKQMAHLRFRRQQPVRPYIVDFYCSAMKLVIELDGSQHSTNEAVAYDAARTKWLEERGYRVLRIANVDLLKNKQGALDAIWLAVKNSGLPLPEPPAAVRPSLKGRVGLSHMNFDAADRNTTNLSSPAERCVSGARGRGPRWVCDAQHRRLLNLLGHLGSLPSPRRCAARRE